MTRRCDRLVFSLMLISSLTGGTSICGDNNPHRLNTDSVFTRALQVNRILIDINSRGDLGAEPNYESVWRFEPSSADPGLKLPLVCDHGPWIIGKLNGIPSAGITYWATSYAPGPVIDGKPGLNVRPQDSLRYHPYLIRSQSDSSDPDVTGWPGDLGAPVSSSGKPTILGDGLIWSVFNGADTIPYPWDWHSSPLPRLPVEIQQSVYAHASPTTDTSVFGNTVFTDAASGKRA